MKFLDLKMKNLFYDKYIIDILNEYYNILLLYVLLWNYVLIMFLKN